MQSPIPKCIGLLPDKEDDSELSHITNGTMDTAEYLDNENVARSLRGCIMGHQEMSSGYQDLAAAIVKH